MPVSIREYLTLPSPDTVWVWDGIIPTSGSMLIYGDPKVGKSKLILSLASAIADPEVDNYLGLDIKEHGKVLYVQLDTPRNLWRKGYLNIIKSNAALDGIFIIDREMKELPIPFDIRLPNCYEWLRREVDTVQPVNVIIDTIRRMHKGKENDSDVMAEVHDVFVYATQPSSLTYISHKRKAQQGDVGDGSPRGSTALSGAVDALVNMNKDKLLIEARSDVAEEIAIYQQGDGTWKLNSREYDIQEFISQLPKDMLAKDKDSAISLSFAVTSRTAKTWRLGWEKENKG